MNKNDFREISYRIFKLLDDDPNLTQRQMAGKMGSVWVNSIIALMS